LRVVSNPYSMCFTKTLLPQSEAARCVKCSDHGLIQEGLIIKGNFYTFDFEISLACAHFVLRIIEMLKIYSASVL
jgi:hypothetical protein